MQKNAFCILAPSAPLPRSRVHIVPKRPLPRLCVGTYSKTTTSGRGGRLGGGFQNVISDFKPPSTNKILNSDWHNKMLNFSCLTIAAVVLNILLYNNVPKEQDPQAMPSKAVGSCLPLLRGSLNCCNIVKYCCWWLALSNAVPHAGYRPVFNWYAVWVSENSMFNSVSHNSIFY